MRIYDSVVSKTPLQAYGREIPADTPMLCIETPRDQAPVFLIRHGSEHCVLKLKKAEARKLVPIEHNDETEQLIRQHRWQQAGLAPVLTSTCCPDDVLEVTQRIELGDGACLVKGQRILCKVGGEAPEFMFFHPLTYAAMSQSWSHQDIKFALKLVADPGKRHDALFEKNNQLQFKWTEYGDGQFAGVMITAVGELPVFQRADQVEVSPLYLESNMFLDVVERLYSAITLREACELGGRVRDIPEMDMIMHAVDYYRSSAVKLMTFGAFIRLERKRAEVTAPRVTLLKEKLVAALA